MKKLTILILTLAYIIVLVGCDSKTINVDLPFDFANVENVEMYCYSVAPTLVEKKTIVKEDDIKYLYDTLERISYKQKRVNENDNPTMTSFRFNFTDGTSYELIYSCYGVKNGSLKSLTENFEYFTIADIGGATWGSIDIESVQVEASELPK